MVTRVSYRRKHTYKTTSNQVRKFKTPGGKLSTQYMDKAVKRLTCSETGQFLNGIPVLTKTKFRKLSRTQRSVSRPYGGVLSAGAVRHRVMRAFFNEEMRVLKQASQARRSQKKTGKGKKH